MTDLAQLAARAEIQDLLARYCRGIDRGDAELVRSVYHPGATDDHGVFSGAADEFADVVIPMLSSEYRVTQHQLSTSVIGIEADTARAETYLVAYHVEREQPRMVVFAGRYLDELAHRDGRWGITARVVAHEAGIAERTVLIEFDSFEQAVATHESAAYQEALAALSDGVERLRRRQRYCAHSGAPSRTRPAGARHRSWNRLLISAERAA